MDFDKKVATHVRQLKGKSPEDIREALIEIKSEDPELETVLQIELVHFEDIRFLGRANLMHLLRDIDPKQLGLALRKGSEELRNTFKKCLPVADRDMVDDVLNGAPQKAVNVDGAIERILRAVRQGLTSGEYTLVKDDQFV